ncbi:small subunit ribosomal protein S9 [Propionibacterium cyclohexanicum]|uniref:Small ribosomal subunit protein uS9 n=1 Tax=Propionibacterium cyclohexanicum TaxID=64702 RepID=A0A1H9S6G9_9ACTN|nr:30S ribosomal protein S9 [Propionibacterium cyclohexanicum]SER80570.1 small subunit ribosomal protein S9 [Propionibacterium cyclohexanicum]
MSQTPAEDIETGVTPFTDENNREIAYRSDSAGTAQVASTSRPAVIAPGTGTGRRKEAVARVRMLPGTGSWSVNGRTLEEYFPNKVHQQLINEPLVTAGAVGAYDVIARIDGGGTTGQAGALRLGIARALNQIDEEANRPGLKKAGLLSRDARIKERKKAGLKKARKAPQYSKR